MGVSHHLNGQVDVRLLFLEDRPCVPTTKAAAISRLELSFDDPNAGCGEGLDVGRLALYRCRWRRDPSGSVLDPAQLLVRSQQRRDQLVEVEPEVAAPALGPQAVVEIEAVDVRDDPAGRLTCHRPPVQ